MENLSKAGLDMEEVSPALLYVPAFQHQLSHYSSCIGLVLVIAPVL